MAESLVRVDQHGPFVRTGGYLFRPLDGVISAASDHGFEKADLALYPDPSIVATSNVVVGTKVKARHIGGTQTGRVAGELWHSDDLTSLDGTAAAKDYVDRHVEMLKDIRRQRLQDPKKHASIIKALYLHAGPR
jgi:hypothetical protein